MDVTGLEYTLVSIHEMLAAFIATPEFALQPSEAKDLARAINNVGRHYDFPMMNPKHQALVGLGVVVGKIYIPRVAPLVIARTPRGRARGAPVPSAAPAASPGGRAGPPGEATVSGLNGHAPGPSQAMVDDPPPDPWFLAMGVRRTDSGIN